MIIKPGAKLKKRERKSIKIKKKDQWRSIKLQQQQNHTEGGNSQ